MGVPVVEPRVLRRQIFSKYTPVCCVYAAVYAPKNVARIGEKKERGAGSCVPLSGVVSEQGIL